ncbi:futalosine hydrolase [Roseiconus lacunae]|uniref:futalosine hydrolase n=1 Tax=Roseiconus lacunae TaxID=2605694 RepID=UPI00308A185F|nr:futalosine hydrolase [Stieleria sp. HD01]
MKTLLLIPTKPERDAITATFKPRRSDWIIETLGFGVIAASVCASELLDLHQPDRVIVAGIAGLYRSDTDHKIGDAAWFDSVAIDGIGVGEAATYQAAEELGWAWFQTDAPASSSLTIPRPDFNHDHQGTTQLVTVCSASATLHEAAARRLRFPNAVGEDMESFAVAFACQRREIAVHVIRGFSNLTGDRDKSHWRIGPALHSVADQLSRLSNL